jgi:hypothetical protein
MPPIGYNRFLGTRKICLQERKSFIIDNDFHGMVSSSAQMHSGGEASICLAHGRLLFKIPPAAHSALCSRRRRWYISIWAESQAPRHRQRPTEKSIHTQKERELCHIQRCGGTGE